MLFSAESNVLECFHVADLEGDVGMNDLEGVDDTKDTTGGIVDGSFSLSSSGDEL